MNGNARQDPLRRLQRKVPTNKDQGFACIKTYYETVNYLLENYAKEDNI